MDKRVRADLFRSRLQEAMSHASITRSALSRATNVDRSTIGQLLKDDRPRLPNAQLAADVAMTLGVSTDWLLGLTNRSEPPGDIVAAALSLSPAERTSADAQLLAWHHEAAGYKVRHVPATLPEYSRRAECWHGNMHLCLSAACQKHVTRSRTRSLGCHQEFRTMKSPSPFMK